MNLTMIKSSCLCHCLSFGSMEPPEQLKSQKRSALLRLERNIEEKEKDEWETLTEPEEPVLGVKREASPSCDYHSAIKRIKRNENIPHAVDGDVAIYISSDSEVDNSPTKISNHRSINGSEENVTRNIYQELSSSESDDIGSPKPSLQLSQDPQNDDLVMSDVEIEANTESSDSNIEYYNDILNLPILLRDQTGMSTLLASKYIISSNPNSQLVAKTVPYDIYQNVAFLISSSAVGHWKNALCDGMGSWQNNGLKTKYVQLANHSTSFISRYEFGLPNTYKVMRTQYVNKSDETLHKIVIRAMDCNDKEEDLLLVQYYFTMEERAVNIKPHGNSKTNKAFVRTNHTTLEDIKQLSSTKKPKEIFENILERRGGVIGLSHPGELPKNRQQISDIKKSSKEENEKDDLKVLLDYIANQKMKPKNTFMFEVTTDPELTIFISEETQLKEIEIFCTNPGNFCILGVDPTFNIGNYMVTITQYRNLKLKSKRNVPPVMLGPVLIHQRKLQNSYFEMPCKMIKHNNKIEGLLAYGTDGEHNLQKAFQLFFPNALHLLCDLHMKDNIKSKLSSLQINKTTASQYMEDIFGRDFETERKPGLVDASSTTDFDARLMALKDTWVKRHSNGLEFFLYFLEEKATLIKNHMTAEIRSMSGLGYPPIKYTQNANESINSAFKRGFNRKLSLTECVKKVQHYVKSQQEQVRLAVISGGGEYQVMDDYYNLMVEENTFYRMGERSREAIMKKFFQAPVVPKSSISREGPKSCGTSIVSQSINWSVPISQCGVTKVPYEVMEDMYQKASTILNKTEPIVRAPGETEGNFFVLSLSGAAPHFIRVINKNGNIVCDNQCIRWKTYKMCPHILALANTTEGLLKKFLDWHKTLKEPGTNLMALTTFDLPKGRGKKAAKSTSIRKCPATAKAKEPPLRYIDDVASTSAIQHNDNAVPKLPEPISGSYMVSLLGYCNRNVTKCYGCQGNLKYENTIPKSPRDIVIVTKMKRKFLKDGIEREGTLGNVYFHFNEQCVKSKDSYFMPCLLFCPDELKPCLNNDHRDLLRNANVKL